jgi:hypothetical protein
MIKMDTVFFGLPLQRRKKNVIRGDIRPSVTYYQQLNHLSDFHEIRYRSSYKKLSSNHGFSENRLSDNHTLVKDESELHRTIHIYWRIFLWKFYIKDLHIMPLNSCEFRENR